MSTIVTITYVGSCPGGNHITISASVDGGASKSFTFTVDELKEPMGWDDAQRVVRDLLRMHFRGVTNNAARQELLAGITLEI